MAYRPESWISRPLAYLMLLPVRGKMYRYNTYHCSHNYLEVSIDVMPKPCYQYNYLGTSSLATVVIQKK